MLDWFVTAFWVGGVYGAYPTARQQEGRFWSTLFAFCWPMGLGYRVARNFYSNGPGSTKAEN